MSDTEPYLMTRHRYLIIKAMQGAGALVAIEAVASTALAHPDWDLDEERTWDEWEKS